MATDTDITDTIERVTEIIEQLESGNWSRSDGTELFEEGQERLADLRDVVDGDTGEIVELE